MADQFLGGGKTRARTSEEHWIPLSDLMTGLMMMFLLVAVIFMIQVQADAQKTKELKDRAEAQAANMKRVAVIYIDMKDQLYQELQHEFSADLPRWGAEIDRNDLAVRFKEPEVLFKSQKAELRPRFKDILSNFFPRYLRILSNGMFHDAIEEIRIEGHTSSIWVGSQTPDKAYLNNMGLSQERTRSVLQFVLEMSRAPDLQQWLREHLTANGLSSSKLRYNSDGTENRDASRRVEFRVRTNADAQMEHVLKAAQQ